VLFNIESDYVANISEVKVVLHMEILQMQESNHSA